MYVWFGIVDIVWARVCSVTIVEIGKLVAALGSSFGFTEGW
jgi:hypothetical protein